MESDRISQKAAELNRNWIESLETGLAKHGDQASTEVMMKAAGKQCSVQIFNDCSQILGKNPESLNELLDAMNQRRSQHHNLTSLWENKAIVPA